MTVPEIDVIVGWGDKWYYRYDFADKLEKFGFKAEIFKITEAQAECHGIATADFNNEIFIVRK